jgi:hypothetical protein
MYLGLWLHSSGVLGASPDGFVIQPPQHIRVHLQQDMAKDLSPELIEVKCPYSVRDMSVVDATLHGPRDFFLSKIHTS